MATPNYDIDPIYTEGWEDGTTDAYVLVAAGPGAHIAAVANDFVHSGIWSCRVYELGGPGSQQTFLRAFALPQTYTAIDYWAYIIGAGGGGLDAIEQRIYNGLGTAIAVHWTPIMTMFLVDQGGFVHGITPYVFNQWYNIRLEFDMATGASYLFRDGVWLGTGAGLAWADIVWWGFQCNNAGLPSPDARYDDIQIDQGENVRWKRRRRGMF